MKVKQVDQKSAARSETYEGGAVRLVQQDGSHFLWFVLIKANDFQHRFIDWWQCPKSRGLHPHQTRDIHGAAQRHAAKTATVQTFVDPPIIFPLLVAEQHAFQALEVLVPTVRVSLC